MTDEGNGSEPTIQPPIPAFENDEFFTCKCNPPFVADRGEAGLFAHRIPIDCMTAEDWQRVAQAKQERAATVYVVTSLGDQDCGFPNEGLLGVFVEMQAAWLTAFETAEAYRSSDYSPTFTGVTAEGISFERGMIYVEKKEVQGDPDSETV